MTNERAVEILNLDLDILGQYGGESAEAYKMAIQALEAQPTGHCKDWRWWKDSDGAYRRGAGAESQCPINCQEVYKGNGYCFMYERQESEDKV